MRMRQRPLLPVFGGEGVLSLAMPSLASADVGIGDAKLAQHAYLAPLHTLGSGFALVIVAEQV
jgi:hypothetical protein